MLHKLRFKTFIGGIITFIFSIIIIVFFYIFGNDFYYRKNPIFTYSSVGDNYSKINLKKEKFSLAFRIEDEYGFIKHNLNNIHIKIYYYSTIPDNENHENRENYKEEYIPYRLCQNSDFENSENILELYGELYCIEWENLTFGGYWDNNFLYYFEIRLFYCEDGEKYSFDEKKCSKIEELDEYFNSNSIYFSVYYTTIDFRVNNLKNPLKRKHINYFTIISHNFRKIDRLFLQEQILNDDQGWIINNHKNISIWGGQILTSDYKYYDDKTLNQEGFDSMFYSFNIYMTSNKNYYTRSYKKVTDMCALIGGLLTCINVIGKIINKNINLSIKKQNILENFFSDYDNNNITYKNKKSNNKNTSGRSFINFDLEKIENNKMNILHNNHSTSGLYSIYNSMNPFYNSFNKNENKFNDSYNFISLYNKNLYSFQKDNNNNSNNNSFHKKKKIKHNETSKTRFKTQIGVYKNYLNKEKRISAKNFIRTNTKENLRKNKIEDNHLIKYMIKKTVSADCKRRFCYCFKTNKKLNFYNKINYFYNEQCDIFHYFKILNEVNFLKEMFLTQEQILAIGFTKKLNINFEETDSKINKAQKKIEQVVNYFRHIFKHKINTNLDNYIYDKLQDEIKCLV